MANLPSDSGPDAHSSGVPSAVQSLTQNASGHKSCTAKGTPRVRASAACNSCRLRRIKCFFQQDHSKCDQCRRFNVACILDHNDGRKRRRCKNDAASLRDRVAALEATLQQRNTPHKSCPSRESFSSTATGPLDQANDDKVASDTIDVSVVPCQSRPQPECRRDLSAPKDSLSSKASNDNSSSIGTHSTVTQSIVDSYQEPGVASSSTYNPLTQNRSYEVALAMMSVSTADYLSQLFWTVYNETFPFINKNLFLQSKARNDSDYYSRSLELSIWLAGSRLAKRDRDDVVQLFVPYTDECKLHRLTKEAVEAEMETQTCLPLIQALLLIADVEASLGHYSAGWMYIGTAFRMGLTLGLDVASTYEGLLPHEAEVRQFTHFMCLVMERYFAVTLKRSPMVKPFDLQIFHCYSEMLASPKELPGPLPSCLQLFEPHRTLNEVITTSNDMQDLGAHRGGRFVRHNHSNAMTLTRELQNIYHNLKETAKWTPENVNQANCGFFLFHQRYYINLILIHQQFAQFVSLGPLDEPCTDYGISHAIDTPPSQLCKMTRMLCLAYAITLARIIKLAYEKLGGRRMVFQMLGHVKIAANTLLMCLFHIKDVKKQQKTAAFLDDLVLILQDLGTLYPIANVYLKSFNHVLKRQRQEISFKASLQYSPNQLKDINSGFEALLWNDESEPLTIPRFCIPTDLNEVANLENLCTYRLSPVLSSAPPIEKNAAADSRAVSVLCNGIHEKDKLDKLPSLYEPITLLPPPQVISGSTGEQSPYIQDDRITASQRFPSHDYEDDSFFFGTDGSLDFNAGVNANLDIEMDSLFPQSFWQSQAARGPFQLFNDSPMENWHPDRLILRT